MMTSANSKVRDEKGVWPEGTTYIDSIQWNEDTAGVSEIGISAMPREIYAISS
jgi:hypothetical protein